MSGTDIRNHFSDIKRYAGVTEKRLDDEDCTMESVLADNPRFLELSKEHNVSDVQQKSSSAYQGSACKAEIPPPPFTAPRACDTLSPQYQSTTQGEERYGLRKRVPPPPRGVEGQD